jgi:DEAD/DEAH box helicase domain-containing protein
MSLRLVIERLRGEVEFMRSVTAWERMPSRPARYADFPAQLDPRLIAALRKKGTAPLYTHQSAAVEAALQGDQVVLVNGTACFVSRK